MNRVLSATDGQSAVVDVVELANSKITLRRKRNNT